MSRVLADLPVSTTVAELLAGKVELFPLDSSAGHYDGIYTYGHPTIDAAFLDRFKGVWDPLESTCRHASLSIL